MNEPRAQVVPLRPGERVGRDAEFSAFMAQAEPALGRMAYLLTGDRHRAEELVQQALVRTYVAWPRARDRDPLAYARRVLANARIDTWRKHRREVLVDHEDLPHGGHDGPGDHHADRDLLVRALTRLPERRRRVVVLRYLLDLGEREVAEDLGISTGAVKSAASRGLAQLRGLMTEDDRSTTGTEVPR
ncbi:SigE family RNA polymerase sigma factor [Isoptericola croceus]|uniref:SigE family RNA polymerase sigma factor n=1 Tax=Isoptericola croceus TaxID=3031406 RepID=UPI0023F6E1EC|nr:SigE family RNA polymerase sigma factor [Isoptericola croceus]